MISITREQLKGFFPLYVLDLSEEYIERKNSFPMSRKKNPNGIELLLWKSIATVEKYLDQNKKMRNTHIVTKIESENFDELIVSRFPKERELLLTIIEDDDLTLTTPQSLTLL